MLNHNRIRFCSMNKTPWSFKGRKSRLKGWKVLDVEIGNEGRIFDIA